MAHAIPKEFFKNSLFESMTIGFLLRCQNLLRQITPKMMPFQAWKKMMAFNRYYSHLMQSVLYQNDILIIFGNYDIHKRQFLLQ
jgi:hypothetical protein